ncbi:hypothetical protein Poli38472_000740 [Pythium oligandrum]|uniref:Uncharacterized protein n=1 Tax=Pythium oligandrum TaxID=41045 RepID=A0A8K1CDP2_PYTOL|nr:hypothetical protein Poli38472_000740 [Pythium oligandrum]|eukprot:TMW60698.1 hypothetical protein Poli38472_000740 [Pythium oligandrum]
MVKVAWLGCLLLAGSLQAVLSGTSKPRDRGCERNPTKYERTYGVGLMKDPSCEAPQQDCISESCRFCQVFPTDLSSRFQPCPPPPPTVKPTFTPTPTQTPTPTPSETPLFIPQQITETPAPLTEAPSPSSVTPAPPSESPAPSVETPAPSSMAPAPSIETPAPSVETPQPSYETPEPSVETPEPSYETPEPSVETPEPSYETPEPSYETPEPSVETPEPSYETPEPSYETPEPSVETPEPSYETPEPSVETPEPSIETPEPSIETPEPSIDTPAPSSDTPAPLSEIPKPSSHPPVPPVPSSETPAPSSVPPSTTSAPATSSPAPTPACTRIVLPGDTHIGIDIVTDTSCATGGLGCIDSVCRFCKHRTADKSAHLLECDSIVAATSSPLSLTPAPSASTSSPVSSQTPATSSSPASPPAQSACSVRVAPVDAALGIDIVSDTSCLTGGLGCLGSACRFCKRYDTIQSKHFLECSSITTTSPDTPSTSPNTTPAPSSAQPTTPIPSSTSSASLGSCEKAVAYGDKAVGISAANDASCAQGGLGCFDVDQFVCRYCRTTKTMQSQHLLECASLTKADAQVAFVANTQSSTYTTLTDAPTPVVAAAIVAAVLVVAVLGISVYRVLARSREPELLTPKDSLERSPSLLAI